MYSVSVTRTEDFIMTNVCKQFVGISIDLCNWVLMILNFIYMYTVQVVDGMQRYNVLFSELFVSHLFAHVQ